MPFKIFLLRPFYFSRVVSKVLKMARDGRNKKYRIRMRINKRDYSLFCFGILRYNEGIRIRLVKYMKFNKMLYWLPRIISVLFIAFLLLFSFDIFSMNGSVGEKVKGLLISNIPVIALVIILLIAWAREYVGGILFAAAAIFFTFFFKTYENIESFMLISFPLLLVAFLFISDGCSKKKN